MSIIRNMYRLAMGHHKALVMDVQEVRERVAALVVARHKHCSFVAGGSDEKYNAVHNEWMAGDLGRELQGLLYWLERAR